MKTLYLDCSMGAAGDMLTAALLELLPDREGFLARLNSLGLPGVEVTREETAKCGIKGTYISVKVRGQEEEEALEAEHAHVALEHAHGEHEYELHEHDHDHDHEPHEHAHGEHEHDHGHEGYGHIHGEQDHGHDHEEHEHSHGECEHDHEEHEHVHGEHDHDHELHEHAHGEHEHDHDHEGYGHTHGEQDHGHDHEEYEHSHGEHDHEGHEHAHGEHDHDHAHGHHHHSSMHDIAEIVQALPVSQKVREDVLAVYGLIAEAESHAHGRPVSEIHFHEVGTLDAVADVTAVCLLMEELAPDRVTASPVHVGSGQVKCAHGILPVPAPATAYILRDVPIYGGEIRGELCTPTGAALLKYFVSEFGPMPMMKVQKIGYGCGKKDFPAANCVRALWGETEDNRDKIVELSCNVDDMTAEDMGFALERLLEAGARDAFAIPIVMKKSRPGTLLRVICAEAQKEEMVGLLFQHTTTLGIRETAADRYVLHRQTELVDTPLGPVHRKNSSGYGVERRKYEYEDLSRIAREQGMSLEEVRRQLP